MFWLLFNTMFQCRNSYDVPDFRRSGIPATSGRPKSWNIDHTWAIGGTAVRKLSSTCPASRASAQIRPNSAVLDTHSLANFGKHWSSLDSKIKLDSMLEPQVWSSSPRLDQIWPTSAQHRPRFGRFEPHWAALLCAWALDLRGLRPATSPHPQVLVREELLALAEVEEVHAGAAAVRAAPVVAAHGYGGRERAVAVAGRAELALGGVAGAEVPELNGAVLAAGHEAGGAPPEEGEVRRGAAAVWIGEDLRRAPRLRGWPFRSPPHPKMTPLPQK